MKPPMPTRSWPRSANRHCPHRSISTAGGAMSRKPSARNSFHGLAQPKARQIVQTEHRQQKGEPKRVRSVEKEALERREIETEQPDLQQRHGQRPVVAADRRSLEVSQRRDDERP